MEAPGGSKRAATPSVNWNACKKLLNKSGKLHEQLINVAIDGSAQFAQRLAVCDQCLKDGSVNTKGGTKLAEFEKRVPVAMKIVTRWLRIVEMVHHIESAIALESQPAPADPIADKIFDLIDTNRDGQLSVTEVAGYIIREFSSKVAHTLLRTLDTDGDHYISRQEWRKGWASGQLQKLLVSEHEKLVQTHKEGERLQHRREGGVMALTAAAAAEQYYAAKGKKK